MLREKSQVAADVLTEHPPAMRRTPDVHALGAGEEQDLPAGLPEAVAPVRLLAEEEERLVQRADLLDGLAPHEHAGAHHDLDLALLVVLEPARIERVEQLRARRELAQEEVLGREPPQRREAAHRALQRPVGVQELGADDRGLRMRVGELHEPRERAVGQPGVGVQQQEVAAGDDRHACVPARGEPQVLPLDQT